jgi:hypothetical protein
MIFSRVGVLLSYACFRSLTTLLTVVFVGAIEINKPHLPRRLGTH